VTGPRAPSTADLAATAAETIRQLNHHTLGPHALTAPAELDRAVAELAAMAWRLPQLLRQLDRWLQAEQHAGRIRSDEATDPKPVVAHATAHLAHAGHVVHELGRTLDDAHQHLAHLGATQPEPSGKRRGGVALATTSADDRAGVVATSGQIRGHQRAGFRFWRKFRDQRSGQRPPARLAQIEEGCCCWCLSIRQAVRVVTSATIRVRVVDGFLRSACAHRL
jgi:hypothetical protein